MQIAQNCNNLNRPYFIKTNTSLAQNSNNLNRPYKTVTIKANTSQQFEVNVIPNLVVVYKKLVHGVVHFLT